MPKKGYKMPQKQRDKIIESRKANVKKKGKNKICSCGKEFYEYPHQNRKFCSRLCANKGNAKKNSKAKTGENNPMYGKKAWNKGIYGVTKHPSNQGKNCHFWKGGISREKYKLRRGGEWKKWRKEVFERDDYTCQNKNCNQRGGQLIPHHIKLFSYYEKDRFKVSNGITVCEKCHKYLHRKENQSKKIIEIND